MSTHAKDLADELVRRDSRVMMPIALHTAFRLLACSLKNCAGQDHPTFRRFLLEDVQRLEAAMRAARQQT